ncbi:MAG: 50S ribosomal protein L10 [Deltaproteobacteria bacterium]
MLTREYKSRLAKEFHEKFGKAEAAFITECSGIKVNDMTGLRKNLRSAGVEFRVLKNTIARLAVKGTLYEGLADHFEGPTAVAIGYKDPVAVAKALSAYVKEQPNFKIKVGALKSKILTVAEVKALSELPTREELLAKLLGIMKNVPAGIVCVLAAIPKKFLYALNAIKDKKAA